MKITSIQQAPSQQFKIYTEPTIERRETGFVPGTKTPTSKLVIIDPTGESLGRGAYRSTEREATLKEQQTYDKETRQVEVRQEGKIQQVVNKYAGAGSYEKAVGGAVGSYEKLNQRLVESLTEPTIGKINFDKAQQNVKESSEYLSNKYSSKSERQLIGVGEFVSGVGLGLAQDIKEKPLKNLALYGVGAGIGFGFAATGTAISSIPKIGSTAGMVFKTGEIGLGVYGAGSYVITTSKKIYNAKTNYERGKILSVDLKDASLIGLGYSKGVKGYQITQGIIRTTGRTEIPTEKIITEEILSGQKKFVENPTGRINAKEYKKLFETKSQVVPEIKEPMGYHQAPASFWKGDKLEVTSPGSSEFPGLYTAYRPSPYFLKIQSGYSTIKFNIKTLFQPYGKPGTAAIIPTKFVLGKSAKPGQAFIPAIKPEVEAIFPVGTKASLLNSKYYYNWKGVRIPLDIFKAEGGTGKGIEFKSLLNSGSYSVPTASSPLGYGYATFSLYEVKKKSSSISSIKSSSISSISSKTSSSISNQYQIKSYKTSYKSKPSYKSSKIDSYISSKPSDKSVISSTKISSISPIKYGKSTSNIFKSNKIERTSNKSKKYSNKKIQPTTNFKIFTRRFGKFKTIGTSSDIKQAFNIGKSSTRNTLGATFYIRGLKSEGQVPFGYYTKKGKEGTLFIQKTKYRLGSAGEKAEINKFKRLSGGIKL
jgi:hypothetical protein